MNIEAILDLEFKKQIDLLCKVDSDKKVDEWQKQYDGKHAILEDTTRDKKVGDGSESKVVIAAKEAVPFQKKIVRMAVAFLLGAPVRFESSSDDGKPQNIDEIMRIWKDQKLNYFNKRLMRAVCIESDAAELWYVKNKDGEMEMTGGKEKEYKIILLCKANGNEIFPHFDDKGDMDAFTRKFTIDEVVPGSAEPKKRECAEIYTAEKKYIGIKKQVWEVTEEPNLFGKIPVIYYKQDAPEWADVQTLIDRIEMLISRHADTNDYYSAPMLKLKGKVKAMPSKTEDGRVLHMAPVEDSTGKTEYGDAEYLTWSHSPESMKLEYENLKDLIYSMTSTPDVSFDNVKSIGNTSGLALKLMFLDAMTKAQDKQEIYGEGFTRRINLLKTMISGSNMNAEGIDSAEIEIMFDNPLPENYVELIDSLSVARGGEAIMSKETAVKKNPLVDDADEEIKLLEKETSEMASIGESYEA